jgi:hypothetical protein
MLPSDAIQMSVKSALGAGGDCDSFEVVIVARGLSPRLALIGRKIDAPPITALDADSVAAQYEISAPAQTRLQISCPVVPTETA